ncbi:hypothetical protein ACFOYW_05530 [Gryllotalpicola reticulitermitis]|uniref:Uncharacterized protein n=1 Tax=Gryllotalpicola reticulitermitis TaxID=1184153 RepID=A0ABV8Q6R3_9MICO
MSTTDNAAEYVTEFLDGPLEGQTMGREYLGGEYEKELDMYVAVEGVPAEQRYVATSTRHVGDTLFVSYRWDSKDSDSIEVDDQDTNI